MRTGNKALRDHAIPFISEFVESSSPLYGGSALSAPEYVTNSNQVVAIPMTQPEKGQIVEAYLYIEMVAPSNAALDVYLGIGTFTTVAGQLSVIPELESIGDIGAMHRKITGSSDPFHVAANGTLTIDADLTRSLYTKDDPEYMSDAFCLLVKFLTLPTVAAGYSLKKFKLSCSAQIGLGT